MKKMLFMAATAALALASCTSEDAIEQAQKPAEDGAVTFSAYTGRAVTRAYAKPGDPIVTAAELATAGGFGVYAFEQGPLAWATYSASNTYPNFFYNQAVTSTDGSDWTYTPVKYFSNNKDAKHSFFAYAPYQATPNVVFNNNGPAIRYNANDNYDLLWAEPTKDLLKPGISHKIDFQFEHALSKVDFEVAYFIDEVHGATHTGTQTIGTETTITLRSVKFVGAVPSQGLLSLADGTWTYETAEASAYEFCPVATVTVDQDASGHKEVSTNNLVLPTSTNLPVKIQVIYDVETVDATNPQNSSKITNTVTSQEEFQLVKGTAYKFSLDLGLTSVKFKAAVTAWNPTDPTGIEVDLPNNSNWHPISYVTLTSPITNATVTEQATAGTSTSGIVFNTTDGCMYNNGTIMDAAAIYVANDKVYTVAADGKVTITTPKFFSDGTDYFDITAPTSALTITGVLNSLNVNSNGQIDLTSGWADVSDDEYYTYTVGTTTYLLLWKE